MTIDESEIRRRFCNALLTSGHNCKFSPYHPAIHSALCDEMTAMCVTALAAEREQHARDVAEARAETLAMDTPWPLVSMLDVLANAADHLLGVHGCDEHGHEETAAARDAARAHMLRLEARAQALNDSRLGEAAACDVGLSPTMSPSLPPSGINQEGGRVFGASRRLVGEDDYGISAPPPSPASPTGETRDERRRARCGHVAYRNHDDMCIDDDCPEAAYVVVNPMPKDAPASAPGGAPGVETCGCKEKNAVGLIRHGINCRMSGSPRRA